MSVVPMVPHPTKANSILGFIFLLCVISFVALYMIGISTGELSEKLVLPAKQTVRSIIQRISELNSTRQNSSTAVTNSMSVTSDVQVNSTSSGSVKINVGGEKGINIESSPASYTIELNGVPQTISPVNSE